MAKLPTDNKVKLLIAEDAAAEPAGKLNIDGYYAGDTIVVNSASLGAEVKQFALPSLFFIWVFPDGEGEFMSSTVVKSPNGAILFETLQTFSKKPDAEAVLMIDASPFATDTFGTFKCIVDLNRQQQYEREFRIVKSVVASSAS